MRTSILGTIEYYNLSKVLKNTKNACKVTHADPRCVASCVAVTMAIALMLQGKHKMKNGRYDVHTIIKEAHLAAEQELDKDEHVSTSRSKVSGTPRDKDVGMSGMHQQVGTPQDQDVGTSMDEYGYNHFQTHCTRWHAQVTTIPL